MQIIHYMREIPEDLHDCVMTIGNFDGIHLAHQKIIAQVVKEARKINRKAVVMTFDPHPQKVLHPERVPFYLITTVDEKLALIESLQVDAAILIDFSHEFPKPRPKNSFAIFYGGNSPRKILIGHDYTFGRGKEGKPEYLRIMGEKLGFGVEVIDAVLMDGEIVSSTRVRQSILKGDVKTAAKLLGRSFTVKGSVIKGFRRGTDLGFPTANIHTDKELIPRRGVYAVKVGLDGEDHPAVANIGFNPTFSNEQLSIEIHILDFAENLYGRELSICFVDRLRDERKFEGPDQLVEQIRKDILRARALLAGC